MSRSSVPAYRRHPNGQSFVYHRSIASKSHRMYLGAHGTEASHRRYRQFLARLAASKAPDELPPVDSVSNLLDLAAAYAVHADQHYKREDGTLSKEHEGMGFAVSYLLDQHGDDLASEFGPKALKTVRLSLVNDGYARTYINHTIQRIKRFFRWLAEEELIEPAIYHRLACVRGLRKGELGCRESCEVVPTSIEAIEAVRPFVSPVVGDMMRVQYYCCMRPGEVCRMRPCDIDRTGDVWLYSPAQHKNSWRGQSLVKAIPPAAQRIIAPRLNRDPEAFLFAPAEGTAWGIQQSTASRPARKTPLYPCEAARVARKKQLAKRRVKRRKPGLRYTTDSYSKAIVKACIKAQKAGVSVEPFSANQIRHAIIDYIATRLGQQKAQRYAGHASLDATNIYTQISVAEVVAVSDQLTAIWAGEP